MVTSRLTLHFHLNSNLREHVCARHIVQIKTISLYYKRSFVSFFKHPNDLSEFLPPTLCFDAASDKTNDFYPTGQIYRCVICVFVARR